MLLLALLKARPAERFRENRFAEHKITTRKLPEVSTADPELIVAGENFVGPEANDEADEDNPRDPKPAGVSPLLRRGTSSLYCAYKRASDNALI